jgi:hypothetical protein
MAHAGFFAGITVYFSIWYRKIDQTMRIGILFGATLVSSAFGGILVCTCRSHKN